MNLVLLFTLLLHQGLLVKAPHSFKSPRYHLQNRCLQPCNPRLFGADCKSGCFCFAEVNRPHLGTCFDGRFRRLPGYRPYPALPGGAVLLPG
uniref:Putative secreted protein n=1 Tax=Amblyomma triste TaxID=251400 RepID=A0A023G068_AMBTT